MAFSPSGISRGTDTGKTGTSRGTDTGKTCFPIEIDKGSADFNMSALAQVDGK